MNHCEDFLLSDVVSRWENHHRWNSLHLLLGAMVFLGIVAGIWGAVLVRLDASPEILLVAAMTGIIWSIILLLVLAYLLWRARKSRPQILPDADPHTYELNNEQFSYRNKFGHSCFDLKYLVRVVELPGVVALYFSPAEGLAHLIPKDGVSESTISELRAIARANLPQADGRPSNIKPISHNQSRNIWIALVIGVLILLAVAVLTQDQ